MQEPDGAEVDVEVEPESQAQQDVACVLVPRNAWIAERAQKDGVHVVAQMAERRLRERLPRLEIVSGGVRQPFEVQAEAVLGGRAIQHRDRRLDDLGSDAVPRDDSDCVAPHSKPVARPQLTQYAQPTSTSLPQAGHFGSPQGGCPQTGQKFTLRGPGGTPPPKGHTPGGPASPRTSRAQWGVAVSPSAGPRRHPPPAALGGREREGGRPRGSWG